MYEFIMEETLNNLMDSPIEEEYSLPGRIADNGKLPYVYPGKKRI